MIKYHSITESEYIVFHLIEKRGSLIELLTKRGEFFFSM